MAWSLAVVLSGLKLIICEPFVCCEADVSGLQSSGLKLDCGWLAAFPRCGLGSGLKLKLLWPGATSAVAVWFCCDSKGLKLLTLRLALLLQLLLQLSEWSEWSGLKLVTW